MKQFQAPTKELIDGVIIKELKPIVDSRGRLMEILRCDDGLYDGNFGQVYITTCNPGVTKAFHWHAKQRDTWACLKGIAKVVLYDMREESLTFRLLNEIYMGEHCNKLLIIPPRIVHGFSAVGDHEAMILNITNIQYDYENPDEFRIDPKNGEVPYNWDASVDG